MFRFVALLSDENRPICKRKMEDLKLELSRSAPGFCPVVDLPGLYVAAAYRAGSAYHSYVLPQGAGAVLGRIFHWPLPDDGAPESIVFEETESRRVVDSQGRHLVQRYWGHYVAFLCGPGGSKYVLRDPTGSVPCLGTFGSSLSCFAATVNDLRLLQPGRFSINWGHVRAFFVQPRLVTSHTGFDQIQQLHAGECLQIDRCHRSRSFHWQPSDIYRAGCIQDAEQAREALRSTILSCTRAWASAYRSIVHELSGGLDSSLVLACISNRKGSTRVHGVNIYTESAEGDERGFARLMAKAVGVPLSEVLLSVSSESLEKRLDKRLYASPSLLGLGGSTVSFREGLVNRTAAEALFTGRGGDHLFQQGRDVNIAAEYFRINGWRRNPWRTIQQTSRLTSLSFWHVLFAALVSHRTFDPYDAFTVPSILTDECKVTLRKQDYRHPWVEAAVDLPACKVQQVFDIVDCQPFHQVPCPYADMIHPLISQPIIECCLRIPCYLLALRGVERGLVRWAFDSELPAAIRSRRSKGATTGYFNRILIDNIGFVREFLLEGLLVGERIIDRATIDDAVTVRELLRGRHVASLMKALRAEAWLRNSMPLT